MASSVGDRETMLLSSSPSCFVGCTVLFHYSTYTQKL